MRCGGGGQEMTRKEERRRRNVGRCLFKARNRHHRMVWNRIRHDTIPNKKPIEDEEWSHLQYTGAG
eukprot:3206792-Pyramimonas_sp.AAC.1